jgi:membrane-bound lytic murein transglycosylase B
MRTAPAPSPRRALLVGVLALAVALGATTPAEAAPATGAASSSGGGTSRTGAASAPALLAQPSPDLPGLPAVSPALAAVPVDSPAFRRARSRYEAVAEVLATRQGERVSVDRSAAEVAAAQARVGAQLVAAQARAAGARSRLDAIEAAIADLAIRLYTSGGPTARVDAALATDQPAINDADRRDVLGSASMDVLLAERGAYRARLDEARARLHQARTDSADLADQARTLTAQRSQAVQGEADAAAPVAAGRVGYEDARVLATIEGGGFPLVALDAYYRAATTTADENPACGVRWWGIAGISAVEGHHGSYGGAILDEHGDSDRRIIGIPLDGTRETQVVADSDGGALDGDPTQDRAVGPMQFIPQTWARFAADGNDDGRADPFNLYDATLAAARYLCVASPGLDAEPGLRSAYFSYNHSDAYVDRVLGFARLYERSIHVPDRRD